MKMLAIIVGFIVTFFASATQPAGEKVITPSGLTIITTQHGEPAKNGDTVYIIYTGMLTNGTVFEASSLNNNEPISFKLGGGSVIKGWEEGITGMQIGEKRHLIIPANLAYGAAGRGDRIPPNSVLEFDVELVGLLRAG